MAGVATVDAETTTQQRALLERLLELTGEQRQALDAGDMAALNMISSLRSQHVKAAAAFVPPHVAWSPALVPLVADLQRASEALQHDLRTALDQVKRDLVELNKREHVTEYVPGVAVKGRLAWEG